jgi:predicted N-acetyltransferase YhbS
MELLINLYALKERHLTLPAGGRIARVLPFEAAYVTAFIQENFPASDWAEEIADALHAPKTRVFIAIEGKKIIGFAAYDATCKDFFGPLGVAEEKRGHSYGEALTYATLLAMKEEGYAYAMVGWAGPIEWYQEKFGAIKVGNSLEESVYSRSFRQ